MIKSRKTILRLSTLHKYLFFILMFLTTNTFIFSLILLLTNINDKYQSIVIINLEMQLLAQQIFAIYKLDVGLIHLNNGLDFLLSLLILEHLQLILQC